ncbi:hypothetical protein ACHAWF_009707 [Thalassiosira exigua]
MSSSKLAALTEDLLVPQGMLAVGESTSPSIPSRSCRSDVLETRDAQNSRAGTSTTQHCPLTPQTSCGHVQFRFGNHERLRKQMPQRGCSRNDALCLPFVTIDAEFRNTPRRTSQALASTPAPRRP